MNGRAPVRQAGGVLFGPSLWAAHFLTIYATEVLACQSAGPRLHDLVVAIATVVAALAIILHRMGMSRSLRRVEADDARHFLWRVGVALDGLSLIGIGWAVLATVLLGACR